MNIFNPISSLFALLALVAVVTFLYWFSVKTIIAVFLWQELDKGYEVTDHPEHDEFMEARGDKKAHFAAMERVMFGNAFLRWYSFPFWRLHMLLYDLEHFNDPFDEDE